ncbi:T9SS type A sorting domain-containing protein [Epilithonimonas sp.]|uniref:T9SS type A sorting domain-containing protein n=1 Tax=Epilithonimonas sp. TaxID=2894511 RepID=UPI002899C174|nr:T9SS type A sorting domain-containing protein [Epilithonimonas sp.]
MKAKLFLAASLLAVVANAQLITINEDFNNFTSGNTTFPQNGWSVSLPGFTSAPPAMMIVTAGSNKYIQAYPGINVAKDMFLITPQIVAPAGDKTLSFDTAMEAGGLGTTGVVQVGVASNPADMTTFVAVGNPIELTSTTIQNVKVVIPASTDTYLVIRTTSATMHTPIRIDNVKYGANLAVNESAFNSSNLKFAVSADNNSLKFSTTEQLSSAKVYSATGAIANEGKIIDNSLDITRLKTGVYFIVIENKNGQSVKSKFIKK